MDIRIVCGFVIRDETETIFDYLKKCNSWPTIEEIMKETGIKSRHRIYHSLSIIKQQIRLAEGRRRYLEKVFDQNKL